MDRFSPFSNTTRRMDGAANANSAPPEIGRQPPHGVCYRRKTWQQDFQMRDFLRVVQKKLNLTDYTLLYIKFFFILPKVFNSLPSRPMTAHYDLVTNIWSITLKTHTIHYSLSPKLPYLSLLEIMLNNEEYDKQR